METLIEGLNGRAHDPERAADEGGGVAAPPATREQVEAAEARLGFALPALLRRVYQEVGDGGFGPGGGLLGLTVLEDKADGAWPKGLIPLCAWGSGIGSLLDCTRPEAPVIRLDPNMPKADVAARVPARMHFDKAQQVKDACWVEAPSFQEWLEGWVDGKRLFYLAYGGADEEEMDEGDDEGEEGEEDDD